MGHNMDFVGLQNTWNGSGTEQCGRTAGTWTDHGLLSAVDEPDEEHNADGRYGEGEAATASQQLLLTGADAGTKSHWVAPLRKTVDLRDHPSDRPEILGGLRKICQKIPP
jgi:hypothetical protein